MEIHTIASSSAGNSYIIEDTQTQLLLEVGVTWNKILTHPRFDLSRIQGALVSHLHGDHAKSLRQAMKYGVDVYATQATFDGLGVTGHRAHAIEPLAPFKVGTWEVLAFPTVHDVEGSVGFLIMNAAGERLVFITDSCFSRYTFGNVTHFLLEVNFSDEILEENVRAGIVPREQSKRVRRTHMSLRVAKDFLAAHDLKSLKSVHLIHLSNTNSDAELFKREIQKVCGCPVFVEEV